MVDLLVRRLQSGRKSLAESVGVAQRSSALGNLLNEVCVLISHLTQSPTVLIARRDPQSKTIKVLGKTGTLVTEVDISFVIPALHAQNLPVLICSDVRRDMRFQDHPLLRLMPHIRSLIVLLIPGSESSKRAVLKIINPKRAAMNDGALLSILSDLALITRDILDLETEMDEAHQLLLQRTETEDNWPRRYGASVEAGPGTENMESDDRASARFLFETLNKKQRQHFADGVNCISLRTWRKSISKYQQLAFAELRRAPQPRFVEMIAAEIGDYVCNAHGERVMKFVAHAPQRPGKQDDALGLAIARQVSARLGAPFVETVDGASGAPGQDQSRLAGFDEKGGASLPGHGGPLLLIDAQVSSLAKWEQAVTLLKPAFHPIYGVTWIG